MVEEEEGEKEEEEEERGEEERGEEKEGEGDLSPFPVPYQTPAIFRTIWIHSSCILIIPHQ